MISAKSRRRRAHSGSVEPSAVTYHCSGCTHEVNTNVLAKIGRMYGSVFACAADAIRKSETQMCAHGGTRVRQY